MVGICCYCIGFLCTEKIFRIRECFCIYHRLIGVIAVIKKVAAGDSNFAIQHIAVVYAKGICFTDTACLAYRKIIRIATASSTPTPAATTATAGKPQQILRTKILLIDIIEITNNRYAPVAIKETHIATGSVPVICSITCIYTPKLPVFNTRFCYNID